MIKIEDRILSPTAINTYLSCPRKFYLRYVKKLRTKPSIHLIRGLVVHKTIHQFHLSCTGFSPGIPPEQIYQALFRIFKSEWEKALPSLDALGISGEEIESFHQDSELMLINFADWFYKNGMPAPGMSEARMMSRSLGVMGIIDAVHEREGEVNLVDYKTSKCAEITNETLRQAAIYALLYQDTFKVIPERVDIHFLKFPDDPLPVHIDENLLAYGKITIESVREKTRSKDEKDYPCTCGGFCERDFVSDPTWNGSKKS